MSGSECMIFFFQAAAHSVPGGIYTDLLEAGVLDSGPFYYRFNDDVYRWVSYENWTYSTTFQLSPEMEDKAIKVLECQGE